jgi:hypothetical protein
VARETYEAQVALLVRVLPHVAGDIAKPLNSVRGWRPGVSLK